MRSNNNNKNNKNMNIKIKKFKRNKMKNQYYQKASRDSGSKDQDLEKRSSRSSSTSSDVTCSKKGISFDFLRKIVSKETMSAVREMGLKTMTEIQAKSILKLLRGDDLLGTAQTGTGKTLAFLIPIVELIAKFKFSPINGTGAIIISPTRELSLQTFGVLTTLMKYHRQSYDIITGGASISSETQQISQGVNILVATPGRLLDHLENTPDFIYKNLKALVIDEADRLFQIGFENTMKKIVKILPEKRQTVLFSATHDAGTKKLAQIILNSQLTEVHVGSKQLQATVTSLTQVYIVCPLEKKLMVLYSFIKKNNDKKGMVFFGSCCEVKFFALLFKCLDIPVQNIHGKLRQNKRTAVFHEFKEAKADILFCTDVAARGWDIPAVDWIIQFDPPLDPKEYIHRVGRTARAGQKGYAILYLRPEETDFVTLMKEQRVNVTEMKVDLTDVENFQVTFGYMLSGNTELEISAKSGVQSFLKYYQTHPLKKFFNLSPLDIDKINKCYGISKNTEITTASPVVSQKKKKLKRLN